MKYKALICLILCLLVGCSKAHHLKYYYLMRITRNYVNEREFEKSLKSINRASVLRQKIKKEVFSEEDNKDFFYTKAFIEYKKNLYLQALDDLDTLIKIDSTNYIYYDLKAMVHSSLDEPIESEKSYLKALIYDDLKQNSSYVNYFTTKILNEQQIPEKYLTEYEKKNANKQDSLIASFYRKVSFTFTNRFNIDYISFNDIEFDYIKETVKPEVIAYLLVWEYVYSTLHNDYGVALNHTNRGLSLFPKDFFFLEAKCTTLMFLHRENEIEVVLREIDPTQDFYFYYLIQSYYQKTKGNNASSIDYFLEAIKQNPEFQNELKEKIELYIILPLEMKEYLLELYRSKYHMK